MSVEDARPVEVRARSGGAPAAGLVRVGHPAFTRRLRSAGLVAGLGLAGGLLFLPIPLIHFFGVALFLASLVFAARRLATTAVVQDAEGTCPACGASGRLFVGAGWRRLRWPVSTSCPSCHMDLHLAPEPR